VNEAVAKALTHPLRVQIFARLGVLPGSAKDLAEEFDHSLGNIAYHLRRLRELGLVRLVKTVKKRGATEKIYEAVAVVPADSLARKELPPSLRSHVSAPALQAMMKRGFDALKAGTLDAREDSHLICLPAVLDARGWKEVTAIMDRTLAAIAAARTESAKRLAEGGEQGIRTTLIVASFESPEPKDKDRL
jgi:DNA-binding transcriptional ArsR family regulator